MKGINFMRIGIVISVVVLLVAFIFGCIHNRKSTDMSQKTESVEFLSAHVIGNYLGNLPCVDCEAINTLLELRRDNSYKLTYTYEGKSDDTFVKQGFWKVVKNNLVLYGVDYKYKISDDKLFQLDLSGNVINGDLAERYELAKVK